MVQHTKRLFCIYVQFRPSALTEILGIGNRVCRRAGCGHGRMLSAPAAGQPPVTCHRATWPLATVCCAVKRRAGTWAGRHRPTHLATTLPHPQSNDYCMSDIFGTSALAVARFAVTADTAVVTDAAASGAVSTDAVITEAVITDSAAVGADTKTAADASVASTAKMLPRGGLFGGFSRRIAQLNPMQDKLASGSQWDEVFAALDSMTAGVNDFNKVRTRRRNAKCRAD